MACSCGCVPLRPFRVNGIFKAQTCKYQNHFCKVTHVYLWLTHLIYSLLILHFNEQTVCFLFYPLFNYSMPREGNTFVMQKQLNKNHHIDICFIFWNDLITMLITLKWTLHPKIQILSSCFHPVPMEGLVKVCSPKTNISGASFCSCFWNNSSIWRLVLKVSKSNIKWLHRACLM